MAAGLPALLSVSAIDRPGKNEGHFIGRVILVSEEDDKSVLVVRAAGPIENREGTLIVRLLKKSLLPKVTMGNYIEVHNFQVAVADKKWTAFLHDHDIIVNGAAPDRGDFCVMPAATFRSKYADYVVDNTTLPCTDIRTIQPDHCYNVFGYVKDVQQIRSELGTSWRVRIVGQQSSVSLKLTSEWINANDKPVEDQPILVTHVRSLGSYYNGSWPITLSTTKLSIVIQESLLLNRYVKAEVLDASKTVWSISSAAYDNILQVRPEHYPLLCKNNQYILADTTLPGNYLTAGKITALWNYTSSNTYAFVEPRCPNTQRSVREHACTLQGSHVNCASCGTIAIQEAAYAGTLSITDGNGSVITNARFTDASGKTLTGTASALQYLGSMVNLTPDESIRRLQRTRADLLGKTFIFAIWKHPSVNKVGMVYHISQVMPVQGWTSADTDAPANILTPDPNNRKRKALDWDD